MGLAGFLFLFRFFVAHSLILHPLPCRTYFALPSQPPLPSPVSSRRQHVGTPQRRQEEQEQGAEGEEREEEQEQEASPSPKHNNFRCGFNFGLNCGFGLDSSTSRFGLRGLARTASTRLAQRHRWPDCSAQDRPIAIYQPPRPSWQRSAPHRCAF
jgi:hypothetical protein